MAKYGCVQVRATTLISGFNPQVDDGDEDTLVVTPGTKGVLLAFGTDGHTAIWDTAYVQDPDGDGMALVSGARMDCDQPGTIAFVTEGECEDCGDEDDETEEPATRAPGSIGDLVDRFWNDPTPLSHRMNARPMTLDELAAAVDVLKPSSRQDAWPLDAETVSAMTGMTGDDIDEAIQAGRFPMPDGYVSLRPYWERDTISFWLKRNPDTAPAEPATDTRDAIRKTAAEIVGLAAHYVTLGAAGGEHFAEYMAEKLARLQAALAVA